MGVDEGGKLSGVALDLGLGQLHRAVKWGIGDVYQLEHLADQRRIVQPGPHLVDVQLLAFEHIIAELLPALDDLLVGGRSDELLDPVHVLLIAQSRQMILIIGVIIIGKEAAAAVKTLHQHALPVHIREAQGTVNLGAAQLPGPVLHRVEQSLGHLVVVDKVHLGKPQAVGVPLFVGLAAQDRADAAHDLPIPHSQPAPGLAIFKGGVLFPVPVLQVVVIGAGDVLGHILV